MSADRTPGGALGGPVGVLRRLPVTIGVVVVLVVVGIVSGGFTSAAQDAAWYPDFAYGLPSLQAGRWWTPVTGTFLVTQPWGYAILLVLVPLGIGWLEWRRGSLRAGLVFGIGQLIAVLGASLVVLVLAAVGLPWGQELATVLDVGPSGGLFAGMTAAAFTLARPWRARAVLVIAAYCVVGLLFIGDLADLEHAIAVVPVIALSVGRFRRPTIREQRRVAWVGLVALGAVHLILALVPTHGPFGTTDGGLDSSVVSVLVDAVFIAAVAYGIHRGARGAWILVLAWAGLNVLLGVLSGLVLVAYAAIPSLPTDGFEPDLLRVSAAESAGWLFILVWLIACRRAFAARARRRMPGARDADRPGTRTDEVRERLRRDGGGPLSWMATWRDNRVYRPSELDGIVAYQLHNGTAIALSDPIAPGDEFDETFRRYLMDAERAGLVPCVFGATERVLAALPAGWRAVEVAEDTIVDLPGLEFTGKKWGAVRTAINRADREGIRFRVTRFADESFAVRAQLSVISEQWVGDKGLPEMRFTLGTLEEADDPAVRLAIAEAADGSIEGFLSWLPVYGGDGSVHGWTLDLMRRRDGGTFPPVMEFLIASSARFFRDEGASYLSLSGAPLAHSDGDDEDAEAASAAASVDSPQLAAILDRLGAILEPVYGFRSLHKFKQKFNPRPAPLYLVYRDGADAGAIGLAIVRAYLPDASVPELVRAGLSMGKE
ncbi:bifunctional lysylphosphatidylglycerol flippase/synthetase MprF [Agromyces seonyuensis]|uniref:DUF2156 domain-containing protein n=1 Tax=Agromyces seonyuensis TaxID=2662446 RepID=A0A6I4NZ32_9MICO|nr:phosphatidylglycerol lysyltransferase domain-containing protein [Agromyces seonyuensis]MWB99411.1 DUF2156 domain-containing protein [Agromyces seonyuensis]